MSFLAKPTVLSIWLATTGGCVVALVGCDAKPRGNPPGPVIDPTMPAELAAGLPRDPEGRPILIQTTSMIAPGEQIALVYDDVRDDPITRWGACLERVVACYRANPGAPVDGCIDQIAQCPDATGGIGCCPTACVQAFHRQLAGSVDERRAIVASFVRGDCVQGMSARGAR